MRIVTWNVNHRVGKMPFRIEATEGILALGPDIAVITEYFPQSQDRAFRDALIKGGLFFQLVLVLILVGGWLIMSVYWRSDESYEDTFSVPLGEAKTVRYNFSHGAAQIEINGNAPMGQALIGTSAVGMNQRSQLNLRKCP